MSTKEEVSDDASVEQKRPELMTTIKRFHMRKFKEHHGAKAEKRIV
jgi:ribosomal protein S20